MTRRNAFLRLRENLLSAKERLGKKLAGELAFLQDCDSTDANGDNVDLAFVANGDEISSRLAELDAQELGLIERALARWAQGMYGICAGTSRTCQIKIPVARLNALPYTPFCINCERELEEQDDGFCLPSSGNWSQLIDAQELTQEPRVNVAELERSLAESRRD